MNVNVVLEQGEDGYYVAHCPALRSCWSQGRTREDALRSIREAIDIRPVPSRSSGDALVCAEPEADLAMTPIHDACPWG